MFPPSCSHLALEPVNTFHIHLHSWRISQKKIFSDCQNGEDNYLSTLVK